MFRNMIRDWFQKSASAYNAFIKALLVNDVEAMNTYMNKVALSTFSYFDTGNQPSDQSLEDTVKAALKQIKEKQYAALLEAKGIPEERIRCLGFLFEGKKVLIG